MSAPAQFRPDVTDEQLRLLRRGASSSHGFLCIPYEAKGRMRFVYQDMVEKGLVAWIAERPCITTAGLEFVAAEKAVA